MYHVCVSELQASVDGLLTEKLLLEQQVEDQTKELDQLREQVQRCADVCVCVPTGYVTYHRLFATASCGGWRERGLNEETDQTQQDHE